MQSKIRKLSVRTVGVDRQSSLGLVAHDDVLVVDVLDIAAAVRRVLDVQAGDCLREVAIGDADVFHPA